MKKVAVVLTLLLALGVPAVFAGPFADLPPSHWALDAVNQLSAKGLLEGYPDGTFKGDRAASRYEVAMAVARVLAKIEKMGQADLSNLATKSDLAALRKLINEFRDELDALGVRVAKAEDKIAALESRVTELERVKISGMLHAMATSTGVDYKRDLAGGIRVSGPRTTTPAASIPAGSPPAGFFGAGATDYTTLFMNPANALPLTSGTGFTMMGELTAKAKLSPEWNGGVTLAAWNQIGDAPNSYTWGVTPPYLSNPFLMGAANNLRVTMDRAWVEKPSTGFEGTIGSFTPYLIPEIIYKGMPNVTYYGPNYLPLYGGDVRGKLENMGWLPSVSYEVFGSRLPAATYVPYGQILLGASAQTEFPNSNLKARLNFQRAYDEDFGTAGVTPGTVPTPWWIFSFGAGTMAGPQEQNTWGIDLEYPLPFWKNWTISAGYASSSYVANRAPTPAAMAAKNSVQGQMFRADLAGKLGAADIGLEYFAVSPYYDPMVLWKDNMFSIFGNTATQPDYFSWFGMWELPYPTVYSLPMGLLGGVFPTGYGGPAFNYYLHNSKNYPHNRDGFKLDVNYPLPQGNGLLWGFYHILNQRAAATRGALSSIGFTDPSLMSASAMISAMTGAAYTDAAPAKGTVNQLGLGVDYNFPWNLSVNLMYLNFKIKRTAGPSSAIAALYGGAVADIDNVNMDENIWKINLGYPLTQKLTLEGGYVNTDVKGWYFWPSAAPANFDFLQGSPYLGMNYAVTDSANVMLKYRLVNHDDRSAANGVPGGNFTGPGWATGFNPGVTFPAGGGMGDFNATQFTGEVQYRF